jgi:hypothetical protein
VTRTRHSRAFTGPMRLSRILATTLRGMRFGFHGELPPFGAARCRRDARGGARGRQFGSDRGHSGHVSDIIDTTVLTLTGHGAGRVGPRRRCCDGLSDEQEHRPLMFARHKN